MMHATVSHLSVHTPQTTRRPVPPRSTAPPHSHSSSRSASRHFRVCASSNVGGEYASGRKRVLVLGGTGFVGSAICQKLLEDGGFDVVSISRRGAPVSDLGWPPAEVCSDVKWMIGDARDPSVARNILKEGGFTAVVHCIGMLLESDLNRFASGSGSVPAPGSTFDEVTRQTALNAAAAAAEFLDRSKDGGAPPFVFVSAAEAAWPFEAPVPFLRRYLTAKKAVERALLDDYMGSGRLRASIMRPSLVWTPRRPGALPAVGAFAAFNAMGVPFIDRPVTVDTLASSVVASLLFDDVKGIHDFKGMDALDARLEKKGMSIRRRGGGSSSSSAV